MCKKTVLAKKEDYEIKFPAVVKKTVTSYPTFKVDIKFPNRNSPEGKQKKKITCPFCRKEFGYKAFRREFSLKNAAKWAGLVIGLGVTLFFVAFALFVFGGWDINSTMWYSGMWGIILLILGIGILISQTLRYLAFYRNNKYRYFFLISGFRSNHVTLEDQKRVLWKNLSL